MARKLYTDFVKVATSGPTIDGRTIAPQDVTDMAESYDPEEYTANIWYEHIRYFGNLGKVVELKAEKDGKGRMCLFARLAPTDELMWLNNNGQKLFTSIEIQPDFADTGKAYLAGLAVTDSPASLGTTELQFNSRLHKPDNYFAEPVELGTLELEHNPGLLGRMLEHFGKTSEPPEPKGTNSKGTSAMDEKQFNKLMDAIESQDKKIEALDKKFSSQPPTEPKKEEGGEPKETEAVSAEQFNELKARFDSLQEKFTELQGTEKPGTQVPEGQGDAATARVL